MSEGNGKTLLDPRSTQFEAARAQRLVQTSDKRPGEIEYGTCGCSSPTHLPNEARADRSTRRLCQCLQSSYRCVGTSRGGIWQSLSRSKMTSMLLSTCFSSHQERHAYFKPGIRHGAFCFIDTSAVVFRHDHRQKTCRYHSYTTIWPMISAIDKTPVFLVVCR